MQLNGSVDLPVDLMKALEEGNLVFFVGAGASQGAPSNLPGFKRLVDDISTRLHQAKPGDGEPLDKVLGDLERKNFDVNSMAAKVLNECEGQPNRVHRAIARLAIASGRPKIITTNFDTLLNDACSEYDGTFDNWVGPAVPLGDDFEGIVQLHGSTAALTKDFVLSDRSFGAAYLTRGWATRFLLEVFTNYVVVFVGYSHDDPVMKYIAYALPPGTRRYAFIGIEEAVAADLSKFDGLGIHPICYSKANNHETLTLALEEWANNAESNWLDQRNRIKSILLTIENVTPPQEDILNFYLSTNDGVERFCSVCAELSVENQVAVLRWLRNTDLLKPIFDSRVLRKPELNLRPLEQWLATLFLSSSRTVGEFWSTVANFGSRLSETFCNQLGVAAYRAIQSIPRDADLVLTFLHTSIPSITCSLPNSRGVLDHKFGRELSVPELRQFLSVRMEPTKTYSGESFSKQRFRLRWNRAARDIRAAVSDTTSIDADAKLEILEQALTDAHLLDRKFNEGLDFDPLGDWFPDLRRVEFCAANPVTAIIVPMVEAIGNGDISVERRQKWSRHQVPLLRNLAILAIGSDPSIESSERIRWLFAHCANVLEPGVRNEAMLLLADNISAVDDDLHHEVFNRICADSGSQLETYRAFHIITEGEPDWAEAVGELRRLEADDEVKDVLRKHAEWAEESDALRSYAPLVLDGLEGYLNQFDQCNNRRVEDWIATEANDYVERLPHDVFKLALAALDQDHPGAKIIVREAISHIKAEDVLQSPKDFLDLCDRTPLDLAFKLAFPLVDAAGNEVVESDSTILERSIRHLWDKTLSRNGDAHDSSTSEILQELLADGAIRLAYSKWRQHDDAKLASRWLEEIFEWFMLSPEASSPVIRAFTSRLGFLYGLNEEFATTKIIPLFNDSNGTKAAWAGFLKSPGLSKRDPVRSQIKSLLEQGWEQVNDRELRDIFREVVLFAIENRVYTGDEALEILGLGMIHSTDEERGELLDDASMKMDNADNPVLWVAGLKDHVLRRLREEPVPLGQAELEAIARLPIAVPAIASELIPAIYESVDLKRLPIKVSPIPIDVQTHGLHPEEAELLAPYVLKRIEAAGYESDAKCLLLRAIDEIERPGPLTKRLRESL